MRCRPDPIPEDLLPHKSNVNFGPHFAPSPAMPLLLVDGVGKSPYVLASGPLGGDATLLTGCDARS